MQDNRRKIKFPSTHTHTLPTLPRLTHPTPLPVQERAAMLEDAMVAFHSIGRSGRTPGVFRSRVNEPPICGVGQRTVAQEVDLPCHARDGLDLAQARADCGRRHIGEREQSHVGRHMSAQAACAFVALSQMANPQPKLARSGAAERGETLRQPRVKIVGELGPEFAVRGSFETDQYCQNSSASSSSISSSSSSVHHFG